MPGYMPLDTTCPLCSQPLNGERFFHLECAKREDAHADLEGDEEDEGE